MPDISVGRTWSGHWCDHNLSDKYGDRLAYEHNYPTYFPQAASNPQKPYCYPEAALGEFRRWFRQVYVREGKFENYLATKVRKGEIGVSFAQLAIASYAEPEAG